jgi:hypothetical protein
MGTLTNKNQTYKYKDEQSKGVFDWPYSRIRMDWNNPNVRSIESPFLLRNRVNQTHPKNHQIVKVLDNISGFGNIKKKDYET